MARDWGGISESMARGYQMGASQGGRLSGVGMALKVLLTTMIEDKQMRKKALLDLSTKQAELEMEEPYAMRRLEKAAELEEPYLKGKEKREYLLGVAKGELPLTAVPEEIRREVITSPKLDITGLKGTPETLAGVQRLPYTTEARGIPEFMKRVTPAETIPEAEARLRGGYLGAQKKTITEIIKEAAYKKYQQGDRSPEVLKALGMWISPTEALLAKEFGFGALPEGEEIILPPEIKTTSQALDYLMKNHNMTLEQALDWIKTQ